MARRGIPAAVMRRLERAGLLLQADDQLPSIAGLVAGEAVRGSWWAHPRAHEIYDVCVALDHRDDVVRVKLLKGKVTHVARALWPALVRVGLARSPWQRRGLKRDAQALLRRVSRAGELRTDGMRWRGERKPGAVVRDLESRLLLFSDEIHTNHGRHAKSLMSWELFCERRGVTPLAPSCVAEHVLEEAALRLHPLAPATLPWR